MGQVIRFPAQLADFRPGDHVVITGEGEWAFAGGWRGRVTGTNSGLLEIATANPAAPAQALTLYVPPAELRLSVASAAL